MKGWVKYVQGLINRWSPIIYLMSVTTTYYLAMDHAIELMYLQYGRLAVDVSKTVATFLYFELMINWLCLRLVSSRFTPSKKAERIRADFEKTYPDYVNKGVAYDRLKADKSLRFTKFWAVQKDSKKGINMAYPYWSWRICDKCDHIRPPRSHHCVECDYCVLKRDHHCYYANNCVGLRNQRHFIVFEFWAVIATLYALIHSLWYIHKEFYNADKMTAFDYFLPVTVIRYLLGYLETVYILVLVIVMYSVAWFFILSFFFFIEHLQLVQQGLTTFEYDNGMKSKNMDLISRLKGCMGEYWFLNFLIPMNLLGEPLDNGMVPTGLHLD